MALLPWHTARIVQIEQATADTRRFWLEIPDLERFDFKPGQFVTLDLPIHEKPNKRWRSYSIASAPDGSKRFELIIVLDKEGLGTPFLFLEAHVGSEFPCRGPQGVFLLKEPLKPRVFMICTGTGIAPFRSMLLDIYRRSLPHQDLYLIFGCRTQADLLYYDEMRALASNLPGFHYIPVLSRENWDGATGYVHPQYELLAADLSPADFYLCGWKGMIDEARQRIMDMGYSKQDIHFEIYG